MITPEQARTKAIENFKSGLNCAQAVSEVFAEELGFDKNVIKSLALPFGGGTCRMRETCGTVSGMMLCLGMALGVPDGNKERKDLVYTEGQWLANRFREKNGSIICRQLLGLEKAAATEPVSEERTDTYYKKRPCPELCGDAAEIFADWLNNRK